MNTLQNRLRTSRGGTLWAACAEAADRIDALESERQVQDAALAVARADFRELALRAEKLEAENFALAAGQCAEVVGDEGGTPRCKRIAALEAENAAQRALLKRAAPLLEDYAEYANTAPIWHATGGTADAINPLVAEVNAAIARSKT